MALLLENEEVVATKYKTLFLTYKKIQTMKWEYFKCYRLSGCIFIKMTKQITIEMNTFEYCEVSVFIFFLTY